MATSPSSYHLLPGADMHIHLRQGEFCKSLTKALIGTGIDTYLVMPNLIPPLTTTDMVMDYQATLRSYAPELTFLMTLYLSPELTPDEIRKAKRAGIIGVKSYPRGVTTNSEYGIESYEMYYPVFKAMEEEQMVLNLHGECPSNPDTNTTALNAEVQFLQHLETLHQTFPKLRIVLEHVTTQEGVNVVNRLGPTVAATVTVHHLYMTIDDWMNQPHHYCKPIAKTTQDRAALLHVIQQGNPKFFLGTDSAPHPKYKKETDQVSAGVYILPQHTLPLLASLLLPNLNNFENFVAIFGRQFYQLPLPQRRHVILSSTHHQHLSRLLPEPFIKIPPFVSFVIENNEKVEVVPFRKGESLTWVVSEQHL